MEIIQLHPAHKGHSLVSLEKVKVSQLCWCFTVLAEENHRLTNTRENAWLLLAAALALTSTALELNGLSDRCSSGIKEDLSWKGHLQNI